MDPAQANGADLKHGPRTLGRRLRALAVLALALAAPARAQEDDVASRGFAIPDTRAARALVDSVESHIAARRWPEALSELQRLIRDHDGDLLGPEYTPGGRESQRPVHLGAAEYARRRILTLPRSTRETYVRANEAEATAMLDEALARSDRAELARVGSLFPATEPALRAWCALGDLELELGNPTEALLAWGRALREAFAQPDFRVRNREDWRAARALFGDAPTPLQEALARRVDFVLACYDGQIDGLEFDATAALGADETDGVHRGSGERLGREMRLPGPGEGVRDVPTGNPGSWSTPFVLPHHAFSHTGSVQQRRVPLHAVRSGDLVLVNDSLRISAINAFSGRLVWQSDQAPGWDAYWQRYWNEWTEREREQRDFFEGLDLRYALISAAASDSIVVAPLQIPVTHSSNSKYTTIQITRIIPSRRLFAFDVETGETLWKHMPPPLWDGESGTFEQRTRVCGPPVIAGGRVLVPSYRLQGRIEFHVACYDLRSGERLWSTGLISGQRELNMFGRPEFAFSAPPVRVEGDRVVVLTQLGSVAALDLFSGTVLWETLYDQLRLQAAQLHARMRPATWKNAPPVVSNGVVLAAPVDSNDLVALDLESGALLWSRDQSSLRRHGARPDMLLGADRNTVYLGGGLLMALASPFDLRTPPEEKWSFTNDDMPRYLELWPALTHDSILVPTPEKHFEVDRVLGQERDGMAWSDSGNLLVTEGAYFTLDAKRLNGYFQWETLIERARRDHEAAPRDVDAALDLASLLTDRGISRLRESRADLARPFAEEAVAVLEPFLAAFEAGPDDAFASQFHESLRTLAQVQRYVADPATLDTLRRARGYATDALSLRDTLLEEHALLHDTRSPEWFEVMRLLEDRCAELEVDCLYVPSLPERDVLTEEFVPRLAERRSERGADLELPVGLWVRIERSAALLRAGRWEEAFEDLHLMARLHGPRALLEGSVLDLAEERIALALERGRGAGYARFAEEAERELERAREIDTPHALEQVSRFYPRSPAALRANDLILASAIRAEDTAGVAEILQSTLAPTFDARTASDRELELYCSLAELARLRGNAAYHAGVVRSLARRVPERSVAGFGNLGALADALGPEPPPVVASDLATFDASCAKRAEFSGSWTFQGYAPGDSAELETLRRVAVFSSRESLMALASTDPTTPMWLHDFESVRRSALSASRITFTPGRVIVNDDDVLFGIDREDGTEAWSWEAEEGPITEIACHDGVLLVRTTPKGNPARLIALDARHGDLLWEVAQTSSDLLGRLPLVGGGHMVFLPSPGRVRVEVRDLFSGRPTLDFELDAAPDHSAHTQAWIEGDLLIEPRFLSAAVAANNDVTAHDLVTGSVAWNADLQESGRRELLSIARHAGEAYLVLRYRSSPKAPDLPGRIMRLHTGFGALQPIAGVAIDPIDVTIGVPVGRTTELDHPYLFLRTMAESEERVRIRSVHLPHGERWTHTLPVPENDFANRMARPVLSDTTVALGYNEWKHNAAEPGPTRLRFIDRASGAVTDARDLPPASFPRADQLELVTLGGALILIGPNQMDVLE